MRPITRAMTIGLLLVTASPTLAQPVPWPNPPVGDLTNVLNQGRLALFMNRQFAAVERDRLAGRCGMRNVRLGALEVYIASIATEQARTGGFPRGVVEAWVASVAWAWARPCPPPPAEPPQPALPLAPLPPPFTPPPPPPPFVPPPIPGGTPPTPPPWLQPPGPTPPPIPDTGTPPTPPPTETGTQPPGPTPPPQPTPPPPPKS